MKKAIILSMLFTYQSYACVGGGDCCTTPECIERNYLANDGINNLTKVVKTVLNHQAAMKLKIVKKNNQKELAFLDKLIKSSRSPRLKKLYKTCKSKTAQKYERQVEEAYRLDYYDYMGGYPSAKEAVKNLKTSYNDRNEPEESSKYKKYRNDLWRVSRFLDNKRIDGYQDDASDYRFYTFHHKCDFSELFTTSGDDIYAFKYDFKLDFKELKSEKYQKVLETLASKKSTQVHFNLKCMFGKNKASYNAKDKQIYIESKGTRKGKHSCNADNHEMHKIPGTDSQFDINPIKIAHEAKVFSK